MLFIKACIEEEKRGWPKIEPTYGRPTTLYF